MEKVSSPELNVASFFSGAGGLDEGFRKKGFNIVFANDCWSDACRTFRENHPNTEIIEKKIEDISGRKIRKILKQKKVNKISVVIGGPPCQGFSRLNNEFLIKTKKDPRRDLFKEYVKKVKVLKPKLVFMENVPDLTARKNHDGKSYDRLVADEFGKIGYYCTNFILNTAHYNVPQERRRIIFVATNSKRIERKLSSSRDFFKKREKKPPTVAEFLNILKSRTNLKNNEVTVNKPETIKKIRHIPAGGYYEHLPDRLKTKKIRAGKEVIVKRYGGHYRRLDPKKPAKTITNNYIIHPEEDRYLTNREKAILHSFDPDYAFCGTLGSVSQQIANAVPPNLADVLASYASFLLEK